MRTQRNAPDTEDEDIDKGMEDDEEEDVDAPDMVFWS